MTTIMEPRAFEVTSSEASPFAEAPTANPATTGMSGFLPWTEALDPFGEGLETSTVATEAERMLAAAFAELRDEGFDEALASLAAETEQFVSDRFAAEGPIAGTERERLAESHLEPVRFEAQQYLDRLEQGLASYDVATLSEEQLAELLDRFDPTPSEVSPAGEEFIGGLVKKAKSAVKFVSSAAKKVASLGLGPVLKRLRALVDPLLKRVLSMAIGRLPAPLQGPARTLAARLLNSEAADAEYGAESYVNPAVLSDVEALAESFDAALAEAMFAPATGFESEMASERDTDPAPDGRQLESVAEARGALIDKLKAADDGEDLAPVVENFIPAVLAALKMGIGVIGRPKVVAFLAKYVAQLIGKWVGPEMSRPLSNAIVDTGLRLVSLETASELERGDEATPVLLATVVEDTNRRLSESEDYVLEDEELLQLATADAFGKAVATHFPARLVRPGLQQAPTIGGAFVARRPRSIRPYRKYSRVTEVEITEQQADALPSFGGVSVGAALRAAGVRFPIRTRVHIYEAAIGTTLSRLARIERITPGAAASGDRAALLHPLTPEAAGVLLREPKLGVSVPEAFLRSRRRIAVGQRFYYLQPLDTTGAVAMETITSKAAPTQAWAVVDLQRSEIRIALFLAEVEAQRITQAVRQGRGAPTLLSALADTLASLGRSIGGDHGRVRIVRELEDREGIIQRITRMLPGNLVETLRRTVRRYALTALAPWARTSGEQFVRAASHPTDGVTVLVTLRSVPGLDMVRQALSGRLPTISGIGRSFVGASGRMAATSVVTIVPGLRRP
jgi:hypothetical protein